MRISCGIPASGAGVNSSRGLSVWTAVCEYMNKFLRGMLCECSNYMSSRSIWHQPFTFTYTCIRIHIRCMYQPPWKPWGPFLLMLLSALERMEVPSESCCRVAHFGLSSPNNRTLKALNSFYSSPFPFWRPLLPSLLQSPFPHHFPPFNHVRRLLSHHALQCYQSQPPAVC